MTMVLAHYGGIDEVGIYVIPPVLAIIALIIVERRVRKRTEQGRMLEETEESQIDVD